ncbi:MAG: hypothetical protein WCO60_01055 [Verrucomicrobiota bacterium]
MKTSPLVAASLFLLLTLNSSTCFGVTPDSFKTDVADKDAARNAVKSAEAAKDNANVPPNLRAPRVDAKMELLRTMILEGIKSGALSVGESAETSHELERIERLEDTYKRSGAKISTQERHQLNRQEDALHQLLWNKTHNSQSAPAPLTR